MPGSMSYNALYGGNEMVVHDINPASAARNLEAGATWADTPKGVTEQSEIVFTSIPGPTKVEAVAWAKLESWRGGIEVGNCRLEN